MSAETSASAVVRAISTEMRLRVPANRCSGSLPHRRAANGGDQGRQVSELIDHLKTADATHIEMGGLFLCKGDAVTGEFKDAQ